MRLRGYVNSARADRVIAAGIPDLSLWFSEAYELAQEIASRAVNIISF